MSEAEQEVPEEPEITFEAPEPLEEPDEPAGDPLEEETGDEPADPGEQTEEEPDQEPEAPAGKTEAEWDKVFKAVDKLRKDNAGRVGRIFEESANELMDCPLCLNVAPGYLWPPDVAALDEQQVTAIRMLLNMPVATDYKQAEDFMPCPKCDGNGRVRTGSKVQNYEIAECPRCFAKGYIPSPVALHLAENGNGGEQDASLTGPTIYGHELPTADPETASVIQSLKDRGYMVVEPLQAPRPASVQ
jgi:hypothetical protein